MAGECWSILPLAVQRQCGKIFHDEKSGTSKGTENFFPIGFKPIYTLAKQRGIEALLNGWLSFCILLTLVDLTSVNSILLLNLAKLRGPASVKAVYFDCR